ncbi:MAG: hypothetical protein SCALA702_20410 [Melioribacteraceae bacterium]|nr:MAG: hypothetical protein SCALA702_20410 [Melioribacteraceae bacterium]
MAQKRRAKQETGNNKLILGGVVVIVIIVAAYLVYTNMQPTYIPKQDKDKFITGKEMIKFNKEGELTFRKASDEFVSIIDIEIAEDDHERADGLMMRFTLQEKQGMLFIFEQEQIQSFWMRNTFVPLDMIFVNSNNEIVTIHKNTEILSDQSYRSTKPAIYVVEVVGGYTDKYNIREGDKILWRRI